MGRHPLVRTVVVAVLVALLAAACSVGVGTPPEDYVPPDQRGGADRDQGGAEDVDLLADGAALAVALGDLKDAVGGGPLEALTLAVYSDQVYLEAQNPSDPAQVDIYNWNAGEGVSSGGQKDVSGVDLEAQLFPVNRVDFAQIPDLIDEAPAQAGIHGDITSSVLVTKPPSSPILTTVLLATPRGQTGSMVVDQEGRVLATS